MEVVCRRFSRGPFTSKDKLFAQACAFASNLGPEQLISISHSHEDSEFLIAVWYWSEPPPRPRPRA